MRDYGTWDTPSPNPTETELLWHKLAAQKVGTPEQQNNSGLSQRKHEIIQLWDLFVEKKPKVIVEVGVAQGGTFSSWCQLAPMDALLIGIDRDLNDCRPRPGEPVHPDIHPGTRLKMSCDGGGIYSLAKQNQRVIGISGWTTEQRVKDALVMNLAGRKIDFLFHDASHSAEMFAKDFAWMWPLIAPGGIFAAHDIQPSAVPECNKSVAWRGCLDRVEYSKHYEFTTEGGDSMGIGVLVKK